MAVSRRHFIQQVPVVRSLVRTAALAARTGRPTSSETPGPVFSAQVPPRPDKLVDDYLRWCGGERGWYRHTLPAHLFPQWGFPVLARTLRTIPYAITKVLNGGCRVEVHQPLLRGEPLLLEAQLEDIDDNGSRAVLRQRLTTRQATGGHVDAWLYAIVPLRESGAPRVKRARPRVPQGARELARRTMRPSDAVDFAFLTGDFNPVHWLPPYARAAGFRSTILHGFATLAFALEALNRTVYAGDASALTGVDVKFVRPLLLPSTVGLYLHEEGGFSVGTAPGGPAYLTGALLHGVQDG